MIKQVMDRIPAAISLLTIMLMCLTWAAGQEAEKTESTTAQAEEETFESSRLTELASLRTEAAAVRTQAQQQGGQPPEQNGTDPRDMASKFMPYYRHTELESGLIQNEFVLFGLMALTKKWALTYELPLAYHRDITGTANCAGLPTIPCFGTIPGGGATLPNGLQASGLGKAAGIGDANIRIFGSVGHALGGDWMTGFEFGLPIASEDVLGSETASLSPMLVYVKNLDFWPAPGSFFAAMNFYKFDIWKTAGRGAIRQYIGRWFFMLPLHPSGIYTLPEFQLIYDWMSDNFSVWIGPEIGKMVGPGQIFYVKPGWGIKNSIEADRKWSLEVGFRWFLQ